jgi:3,4-dihydroxy 2-butanone 4-phosphate synthase/GTP cyclohydrolase II
MPFASIPDVLSALQRGEMIVLVDDESRENEGDVIMAGEFADAKSVAFMATRACGLICLAMEGRMLDRLGLPLMSRDSRSRLGTAFTLSIEARDGVTTGISAADRARTIQVAIRDDATPEHIVVPGHVFPLRARDGGVLVRAGHTEATVDLARLAGLKPAGVLCEIMNADGTMARLPELERFAREHRLPLATIADLIAWREARETLVSLAAEAPVETSAGLFRGYAYANTITGENHLALVRGERLKPGADVREPVLVRVQKESPLSDLFAPGHGGLDPRACLQQIAAAGEGVLLYMNDPDARALPSLLAALGGADHRAKPLPAPAMDPRDYGIGAQILHHLGVRRMRLITGSDRPISALSGHGLELVERVRPGGG